MYNIELTKDDIDRALEHCDLDPESVRFDYSGRYMYGSKCFGLTGDLQDFTFFMLALSEVIGQENVMREIVEDVATDSMGYDKIYYFPHVVVTGVDDEEENDDE